MHTPAHTETYQGQSRQDNTQKNTTDTPANLMGQYAGVWLRRSRHFCRHHAAFAPRLPPRHWTDAPVDTVVSKPLLPFPF